MLDKTATLISDVLKSAPEIKDLEDNRFIPGIQWEMNVDKAQASKFGLDILSIGNMIKIVTNGIKIGTYRPQDSRDQLDVILKFPNEYRTIEELSLLKIGTRNGLVPLSSMMTYKAQPKVGVINRVGGVRTLTIKADVKEGILVNNILPKLKKNMENLKIPSGVKIEFKGQEKDQQDNMVFLGNAFLIAIFIIFIILITQFNSFFSASLILSAVVMSTVGVFVGLLITGMPFGIVMGGLV